MEVCCCPVAHLTHTPLNVQETNKKGFYGRTVSKFEEAPTASEVLHIPCVLCHVRFVLQPCARHYLYAMCSLGRLKNLSIPYLRDRLNNGEGQYPGHYQVHAHSCLIYTYNTTSSYHMHTLRIRPITNKLINQGALSPHWD